MRIFRALRYVHDEAKGEIVKVIYVIYPTKKDAALVFVATSARSSKGRPEDEHRGRAGFAVRGSRRPFEGRTTCPIRGSDRECIRTSSPEPFSPQQ